MKRIITDFIMFSNGGSPNIFCCTADVNLSLCFYPDLGKSESNSIGPTFYIERLKTGIESWAHQDRILGYILFTQVKLLG
jgi:hypothetical protein